MLVTTDLLKKISIAAHTSDFAKEKLANAKKSYEKVKDQLDKINEERK